MCCSVCPVSVALASTQTPLWCRTQARTGSRSRLARRCVAHWQRLHPNTLVALGPKSAVHGTLHFVKQNYNILSCAGASPTDRHPYQVCNQWIEPGAVETLAFDKNVTYMVFECVNQPRVVRFKGYVVLT